jgi:hypothetical protein
LPGFNAKTRFSDSLLSGDGTGRITAKARRARSGAKRVGGASREKR